MSFPPVNTKCLITGFVSIFFPSVGPCLALDTSKCLINIFKEEKEGQREEKRRKEVREGGGKNKWKEDRREGGREGGKGGKESVSPIEKGSLKFELVTFKFLIT